MTPILFAEATTTFTTNGIGRLTDAISCYVTEERNGQYELAMVYPVTGQHYSDVRNRAIIGVIPYVDATLQPFRIYKITKPLNGKVAVYARHISYDLNKNTAMPFSVEVSSTACNDTLQGLKSHAVEECPFAFETDVTTLSGYNQTTPSTIRQRLGGIEGSVLDQFGGEYEWDGYTVKLLKSRGHDNGVELRYGKNIIDLTQEEIISETVTGVVPFWSNMDGTEVVTLPEKAVYSQYAERYSQKLTVPLDMSGDYEEAPDAATLRAAAEAYVTKHDLGVPTVSIKVSFVNLADTIEYAELAHLQTVHLCDTITVRFEPLNIETKAKIVAYTWNVLAERYDDITVGSIRASLATSINDQNGRTAAAIDKTKTQAGNAINKATAWLSSGDGYIVAIKGQDGEWKELLAMDTNDIETAQKVMRLNENGLGGSSNGIDGPYNAAILVDGTIVADAVKTGILTDLNDKFYLNMETGELVMKDGTFTGLITGSTARFGQGNLRTELTYGPSEGFGGQNALLISGNDRIAIESTAYQVRVVGASTHMGTHSGNTYINTNENYIGVMAKKMSTIAGGNTQLVVSDTGIVYISNGRLRDYVGLIGSDETKLMTYEANNHKYLAVYVNGSSYGSVQLS